MIRILLVLLALAAGPAAATQDAWPALFDVTGVAANDVLNVRARPDASAPIVGTLAPDARNVEVIRADEHYRWGLVNIGEGTGWASLAYLARHPGQWDGHIPASLSCSGTEPFWSLDLSPSSIRLDGVDLPARDFGAGLRESASNRRDRWSFRAWDEGTSLTGVVISTDCSDGMSDRSYGLSLDLILSTETGFDHYAGCCSLAP